MPRRRHPRRLEWSNTMQSHITLVDQPLDHPLTAPAPRRTPLAAATFGADTFGADNFAADARPAHIRATPRPSTTAAAAAASIRPAMQTSRQATRTQTLPSDTLDQAETGGSASGTKAPRSVVRRLRDSLKRQLRSLGHIVLHVPDASVSIN
ncbi:hypothetical protein LPJ53_002168 [Coemansia erecta]|uniref:Uncharacterized protein n=1 Tax=Coemansia erecta TaxID=147472 RepID=A0A9W7XYQ0_9FUNG|nr:hypothetical protein LPJ53_002168 [Coemansia erecta]